MTAHPGEASTRQLINEAEPTHVKRAVLKSGGEGPLGIGDPSDKSLRQVEKDVLIPVIIRNRARLEKCRDYFDAFRACGKASGLGIVFKCRRENEEMKECFDKWFHDADFVKECTDQYLTERTEFRRTGIMKKKVKPGRMPTNDTDALDQNSRIPPVSTGNM